MEPLDLVDDILSRVDHVESENQMLVAGIEHMCELIEILASRMDILAMALTRQLEANAPPALPYPSVPAERGS